MSGWLGSLATTCPNLAIFTSSLFLSFASWIQVKTVNSAESTKSNILWRGHLDFVTFLERCKLD
jgi:hypothetical protein